ncbi:EamA family transporter [Streptacidiphilus monticola]
MGFGGIAAQQLFTHHSVTPDWLVSVRMSGAGLLLLAVLRPAWPGRHWPRLLAVALPGMAATQYTWFAAIQHSNAATATFLQYTGLAMTAGWQLLRRQIRPTAVRLTAIALAATGAGLLVLGAGGFSALRLDPLGTVLALLSAVSYSYCMIASVRLVRELGAGALTAWGLTVCGLAMLPLTRPWQAHPTGSGGAVLALTLFVTVGATAVACTLSSRR